MMSKYDQFARLSKEPGWFGYRQDQIKQAIFRQRIGEYARMTALPTALRDALTARLGDGVCRVQPISTAKQNQVEKVLFRLPDGRLIETVALRYRKGWSSFCVSSQCGCGFGCAFCATGALGLARNLSAEEMTDQVLHFHLAGHNLDSVSFMGMGEPLANSNLMHALGYLTDASLFGLGQRRITVSTIGIVPGIQRLTREYPQVNLAFSLHTPFDRQRSELMPINRRYPLREVMTTLDEHVRATGRKAFLAYTLLGGVNDSDAHLDALVSLVRSRGPLARLYHIDLIRYNPGSGRVRFKAPDERRVRTFKHKLEQAGIQATIRAQFGAGIQAACGQLCAENTEQKKEDSGCQ